MAVATDIDALLDMVALKLMGGEISETLRNEAAGMLALIPETEAALRAAEAILLCRNVARIRVPAVAGEHNEST